MDIIVKAECFIIWADKAFCVHPAAEAAYVYVCYSVVYDVNAGNNGFIVPGT